MFSAQAQHRSIPGAVATVGVSDRVAFLRRTYAHLGVAIFAFVAMTYAFMQTDASRQFTVWAFSGQWNWMMVLGLFMAVGFVTDRLAQSETSVGTQYLGLGLGVAAQAVITTPLLFIAYLKTGDGDIIAKAGVATLLIFAGLTATVFVTRKDFSFMRGVLSVATFGALGLIIASAIFGFSLGTIFVVAMIVLMAGYVLYQTSQLMGYFRPTQHVAAALMLFSTIATLFWYVLRLFMSRD